MIYISVHPMVDRSLPIPIVLSPDSFKTWIHRTDRWKYSTMCSPEQFIQYFFQWLVGYSTRLSRQSSEHKEPAVVIGGIREAQIHVPPGSLGMLISCENCKRPQVERWGYWHYNKYGDIGDPNIHIYVYNHCNKVTIINGKLIIPFVYFYVSYWKRHQLLISPSVPQPFERKKFCFITTTNHKPYHAWLRRFGHCDHIAQFKDRVGDDSCYHSQRLIDLLNEYRFVFCGENAFYPGYMTEKIFNVFFARSVPIYVGAPDTSRYLDLASFIALPPKPTSSQLITTAQRIQMLNTNEAAYQKLINAPKIAANYTDENYEQLLRMRYQAWANGLKPVAATATGSA